MQDKLNKKERLFGIFLYISGLISILLLLANGLTYITINSTYIQAIIIFIAFLCPVFGFRLIKKSKK